MLFGIDSLTALFGSDTPLFSLSMSPLGVPRLFGSAPSWSATASDGLSLSPNSSSYYSLYSGWAAIWSCSSRMEGSAGSSTASWSA
jgi:hypothetical protein